MGSRATLARTMTASMTAEGLFVLSTRLGGAPEAEKLQQLHVTCRGSAIQLHRRAVALAAVRRGHVGSLDRKLALPTFAVTLPLGARGGNALASSLRNTAALFAALLEDA